MYKYLNLIVQVAIYQEAYLLSLSPSIESVLVPKIKIAEDKHKTYKG